jgi:hypothetical protein
MMSIRKYKIKGNILRIPLVYFVGNKERYLA